MSTFTDMSVGMFSDVAASIIHLVLYIKSSRLVQRFQTEFDTSRLTYRYLIIRLPGRPIKMSVCIFVRYIIVSWTTSSHKSKLSYISTYTFRSFEPRRT